MRTSKVLKMFDRCYSTQSNPNSNLPPAGSALPKYLGRACGVMGAGLGAFSGMLLTGAATAADGCISKPSWTSNMVEGALVMAPFGYAGGFFTGKLAVKLGLPSMVKRGVQAGINVLKKL